MPDTPSHVVASPALNLRRSPEKVPGNQIATLPQGHPVLRLEAANASWWRVQTTLSGATLEGFVNHHYLAPTQQAPALPRVSRLASVHLAGSGGLRAAAHGRASPLDEPNMPRREPAAPPAARSDSLWAILRFLDVEQSRRYLRTQSATFCNIYAYDYCYLAGTYLPRVWWTSRAIARLTAGESVTAAYGSTLLEQTANQLFDWLNEWGDEFGWVRAFDLSLLQERVNEGTVGIVCAQHQVLSRSGHITVVLPELGPAVATRSGSRVTAPLQSQAGTRNRQTFAEDWWVQRAGDYRETGFWYHDASRASAHASVSLAVAPAP